MRWVVRIGEGVHAKAPRRKEKASPRMDTDGHGWKTVDAPGGRVGSGKGFTPRREGVKRRHNHG